MNHPYRELIAALAWIALGTRQGIAFAPSSFARIGHDLGRAYWDAAKQVLRYLTGTNQWRLTLGGRSPEIAAFMDTDLGSHRDDRRSIGEYTISRRGRRHR